MVKCAVIGAGQMGLKIAGEMAFYGHRVKVFDSNTDALNAAHGRIESDKAELIADGIMLQENFAGQILFMSQLQDTVKDADIVFEAIIDDLTAKQELFKKIDLYTSSECILTTNTLYVDVEEIFLNITNKERTLGLRFLFPVYYIPEVEITPSKQSAVATIERVRQLLQKMGKTLFFRSGNEPLILSEVQRNERKRERQEQLLDTSGLRGALSVLPSLRRSSLREEIETQKPNRTSDHNHDPECAICLDKLRNCVLVPCHHLVLCSDCADLLHSRTDFCPVCRSKIQNVIRIYHS